MYPRFSWVWEGVAVRRPRLSATLSHSVEHGRRALWQKAEALPKLQVFYWVWVLSCNMLTKRGTCVEVAVEPWEKGS